MRKVFWTSSRDVYGAGRLKLELQTGEGACLRTCSRPPYTISKAQRFHTSLSRQTSAHDRVIDDVAEQKQINLPARHHARDKLAQREFFMDVLNVSATKRDAKQYLARFRSPSESKRRRPASAQRKHEALTEAHRQEQWRLDQTGVNLGGLYSPGRAIAESPTFQQQLPQDQTLIKSDDHVVHVALVGIRAPQTMDDRSLDGLALTLAQLVRLDMQIVIALDCGDSSGSEDSPGSLDRATRQEQADRIVHALEKHNNEGAKYIDAALRVSVSGRNGFAGRLDGKVEVLLPDLIVNPLKRTSVSIVPTLAYTDEVRAVPVSLQDSLHALTKMLSGVTEQTKLDIDGQHDSAMPGEMQAPATSLDRIILVDPLGGLPSEQREDGAHVFVNLDQEYEDIINEYQNSQSTPRAQAQQHARNMSTLRDCLALLPPTSSALIISPEEAVSASLAPQSSGDLVGISTRRQKNPLIHNLLTNKPVISSSLPAARLSSSPLTTGSHSTSSTPTRSTLVKRGMPLIMIPDPRKEPWMPPANGESSISLENHPEINFPRLLGLIEDSFRRELDVQHYLRRIENRIAGIIIAGEYEGGAILTWEAPPSSSSTGSEDVARLVPYLDKFAVLQRSQGNAGVADIVFQAMVRSCFPQGVCWRSRKDNPVNKWYFERAKGSWQIPDSNWTMFWTTDGVEKDTGRWEDYVGVCRSVQPSWADAKKPD